MPKMHQNTFAGRALPGPAGSPRPSSRKQGVLLLIMALKKVALSRSPPLKFDTRSALEGQCQCYG